MKRAEHDPERVKRGESILEKEFVESVLESARETLRAEGALTPALLLQVQSGKDIRLPVSLENSDDEREFYFATLSKSLEGIAQPITESLLVVTGSYAASPESKRRRVRDKQEQKKYPVLSVAGRNRENTRFTCVLQFFRRIQDREFLFGDFIAAEYAVSDGKAKEATWFLAPLFLARRSLIEK